MKSEIPFSGIGANIQQKTQPLSPLQRQKKKRKKILDLTERGESDDIEHGSIIRVSTVNDKPWSAWGGKEINGDQH